MHYDTIIIKDVEGIPDGEYQTKDLCCEYCYFRINETKSLEIIKEHIDTYFSKTALPKTIGNVNGYIKLYNEKHDRYIAIFKDGVLVDITNNPDIQKMYYDSDVGIDFSTFTYLDDDNILRIIDMENGVAKINFIITSIINCDWVGLKELLSPPLDKAYLIEDNSYVNEYNDIYKIYLQNNKLYGDIYLWPTDRLLSLLSNPYIKYFNYIE